MRRFVETNRGEAVGGGFRAFVRNERNGRQLVSLRSNTPPLVWSDRTSHMLSFSSRRRAQFLVGLLMLLLLDCGEVGESAFQSS